jgi:hypothetical protein
MNGDAHKTLCEVLDSNDLPGTIGEQHDDKQGPEQLAALLQGALSASSISFFFA